MIMPLPLHDPTIDWAAAGVAVTPATPIDSSERAGTRELLRCAIRIDKKQPSKYRAMAIRATSFEQRLKGRIEA